MKKKLIFSIALVLAVPSFSYAADYTWKQKLVMAAPLSVVGYGAYRLARWVLGGEYSEIMYARAQQLHQGIDQKYENLELLGMDLNGISETDLTRLAQHNNEIKIAASANTDLQRLSEMRNTLEQRIERDKHMQEPIIDSMQKLTKDIKNLEAEADKLIRFWQTHGNYFDAYRLFNRLYPVYRIIQGNVKNHALIKKIVITQGVAEQLSYPFLSYARDLQSNISQLSHYIKNIGRYPMLYNKCESLEQDMREALAVVVSFPDYMNEVHLKRQHDLEQERIENERRRVEAETQRARIEQERMERQKARERAEMIAAVTSGISNALERAKANAEKAKAEADKARFEKERHDFEKNKERARAEDNARFEKERLELEKEKARIEREKARLEKERAKQQAQPAPVRPPAYNPESQKPEKLYPDLNNYFYPNPAPSAPPMDDDQD